VPISLRKAIQKKKKGHFLKCAECGETFTKNVLARDHRDDEDHDDWFLRYKSLRNTGVYQKIDATR
jgi:hypothetical protein